MPDLADKERWSPSFGVLLGGTQCIKELVSVFDIDIRTKPGVHLTYLPDHGERLAVVWKGCVRDKTAPHREQVC